MKENIKLSEYKRRVKEKQPEERGIELIDEKLKVPAYSPAEQIRFEENAEFSSKLYDLLGAAIKNNLGLDELKEMASEIRESLRPAQAKALDQIIENFDRGCLGELALDSYKMGNKENNPYKPPIKKYEEDPQLAEKYLHEACPILSINPEDIDWEKTRVNNLGTGIMVFKDGRQFRDFAERYGNRKGSDELPPDGIFFLYEHYRNVEIPKDDYDIEELLDLEEQIKRMVYTYDQDGLDSIIWHECFHELYDNFIKKTEKGDGNYLKFKNELIAHLFEKRWPTNINRFGLDYNFLYTSAMKGKIKKELEKSMGTLEAFNYIFNLPNDPQELRLALKDWVEKDIISQEQRDAILNGTRNDFLEFLLQIRELKRLKYIKSDKHEEALKKILCCRSPRETRFQLSGIDQDKRLDASDYAVKINDSADTANAACLLLFDALEYQFPIVNLDKLVESLEQYLKDGRESGSKEEIYDIIEESLNGYREKSKLIKIKS